MYNPCEYKSASINGNLTISTVAAPDATFVSSIVGKELQFRGLAAGNGITLNATPDSIEIGSIFPYPIQPPVGVIGFFTPIFIDTLPVPNRQDEQTFSLASSEFNSGIMVGPNMTITIAGKYLITTVVSFVMSNFFVDSYVAYRIKNSGGAIVKEVFCKNRGNDNNIQQYTFILDLPPDVYNFTVQCYSDDPNAFGSGSFQFDIPRIMVKLI
jgi:hypothetical protein